MAISNELAFASLRTLGTKLRAREFTSVELCEFFLQRVETVGSELNAVVTVTRTLALGQAQRADRELAHGIDHGPLHGIPFGVKDLLATSGIPTTWGAAPLKDQVFDYDATVIRRLREAGAVLIAKLAMIELAGGLGYRQANASFTGPCYNPWNRATWSSGSSSGPASGVAAGLVPFAIGSETWGSIVSPASYCGITGLRPTYGRVSRHGAMALSWSMDKLGPMCRSADDCGLVLHAIAGPDPADPSAVHRSYRYPPGRELQLPFKLATLKRGAANVQPEVRKNYEEALDVLRQFATLEEIELPSLPYAAVAGTIISCEMAAAFENLVTSGDVWKLTAPEDRSGAHAAQLIPAKDYINALRIRVPIQQALDALLADRDAIVTPTLGTVASPLDRTFHEYNAHFKNSEIGGAGNVAGIPALTVPNGFGERNLPTGLQFVGRAFAENRLIAIANRYQAATTWHERHPSI
jgi:aspartyl-tRNA(Asn)/glutamyl-tRNA(Gln) amidotransferase subunit A